MSNEQESTPAVEETQAPPKSGSSPQPGGQPISVSQDIDPIVKAVLDQLDLDDRIDKRVQSVKDKRFASLEKNQEETKDRLDRFAELIGEGKSVTEAKSQLDLEDNLEYIRQLRSSESVPIGAGSATSKEVEAVAYALSIDLNEPDVKQFLASKSNIPVQEFTDYIKQRQSPPPSIGDAIGPSGGQLPKADFSDMSDDDLGAKLRLLVKEDPRGSLDERSKLTAELGRRDEKRKNRR